MAEIDRKELIEFARTQDTFGTIIKHTLLIDTGCGAGTGWQRTQYDTFTRNPYYDEGYEDEYDNTSNMTVEWSRQDQSTYITSKLLHPSSHYYEFNNMEVDLYTRFKYLLDKTSDIDNAWDKSTISYWQHDYEMITWLMELVMGEKENILDTHKSILDKLGHKYEYENNRLSMPNFDDDLNKELDILRDAKIEKLKCFVYNI